MLLMFAVGGVMGQLNSTALCHIFSAAAAIVTRRPVFKRGTGLLQI